MNDRRYEVEFVKSENEHKEQILNGFFILQFAKLKMAELYFNLNYKSCDVTKFEDLDTNLLYLALSEQDLFDCVRPAIKRNRTLCEVKTIRMNFQPT